MTWRNTECWGTFNGSMMAWSLVATPFVFFIVIGHKFFVYHFLPLSKHLEAAVVSRIQTVSTVFVLVLVAWLTVVSDPSNVQSSYVARVTAAVLFIISCYNYLLYQPLYNAKVNAAVCCLCM
jgi:hypothetical protein